MTTETKTTHTPGPWFVDADRIHTAGNSRGVTVDKEGGRMVATIQFLHMDGSDEEWANARLIAASPDLLAALTALHAEAVVCVECLEELTDKPQPEDTRITLGKAWEAIQKATAEHPASSP